MFSIVYSAAVYGIDSRLIRVEADVSDGLPSFDMVGFLSTQVKEAQNRVRTALKNSGYELKPKRITVNLSPADLKKNGTGFDLPIAVAILAAYGILPAKCLDQMLIVGELSLDGSIHSVSGILAMVADAKKNGIRTCVVPAENTKEAEIIQGVKSIPVKNLGEFVDILHGKGITIPEREEVKTGQDIQRKKDFSEIYGQFPVKRAAMIAAAGFHNMLMIGPPGTGKSMIASRIPGIMPSLTLEEQIELSKIYSVCKMLPKQGELIRERPFRAPHHTITAKGLTGGGIVPKPGEISLAHHGILFLDEFPEFSRESMEILRQPLETKWIHMIRNGYEYSFPADIMLVAAMNPCPCGYFPDFSRCSCQPSAIRKYVGKISYPLLDRIDLTVEVPEIRYQELNRTSAGDYTTEWMKEKVEAAREIQKARFRGMGIQFNSQIEGKDLEKYCEMKQEEQILMKQAYENMKLSVRGLHKILKTARTIADLEGSERIREEHLSEAFFYRNIRNQYW